MQRMNRQHWRRPLGWSVCLMGLTIGWAGLAEAERSMNLKPPCASQPVTSASGEGVREDVLRGASSCPARTAGASLASAGPLAIVTDPGEDHAAHPTDLGATGAFEPSAHALPDLLGYRLGYWKPDDITSTPYLGEWNPNTAFLRLDLTFNGLVNPPGPLGCCGNPAWDPYRYGPRPLSGYVEFDVDPVQYAPDFGTGECPVVDPLKANTGGELDVPQLRYVGNVARFGGLPPLTTLCNEIALDAWAFDHDPTTPPYVERSGEDFHLAIEGGEVQRSGIIRSDPRDWEFNEGETWIVPGHFFQRAHGYTQYSSACCRNGAPIGRYDPLVELQFKHDTEQDRTTVSLVYPLTNAGSALWRQEPEVQDPDVLFTNQNSVHEALEELHASAVQWSSTAAGEPEFLLLAGWEFQNLDDYLDPTTWDVTVIVGTCYEEQQETALYVWSDIYPNVIRGDLDGNGCVDATDLALFHDFVSTYDGMPGYDGDYAVNGQIEIIGYALNFSLYDVDYDGDINARDEQIIADGFNDAPGDFDHDGDVDLRDFGRLQACLRADDQNNAEDLAIGCLTADLTSDGNVDHEDLAIFMMCVSGPAIPADPDCAAGESLP